MTDTVVCQWFILAIAFLNTFIQIELISFPVVLISIFSLVHQTVIRSKCEWVISLFFPPTWCVPSWQSPCWTSMTDFLATDLLFSHQKCKKWLFDLNLLFFGWNVIFPFFHESHIIPFLDSNFFWLWTLIWWAKKSLFFSLIDLILIWTI